MLAVVLLNSLLLRRRLEPMGQLVSTMERGRPRVARHARATSPRSASSEVQRLTADFNRMLGRLEHERREAGRAVLRAQEQERTRIAQDLHDEVNQALTGDPAAARGDDARRPAATCVDELAETKALATQAMEELLHLARELRPTALDDHGLVPALASQIADFGERTGIRSHFTPPRASCRCSPTRSSS